jgi:hypothetical protein
MVEQKVDYFRAPKVILQIVLAFRMQQFFQHGCSRGTFRDRLQKFRRRLRDRVISQQRFAQRFGRLCGQHWFVAFCC